MTQNGFADEWEHNKQQFLKANEISPIAKIQAIDQGQQCKTASSESANGLDAASQNHRK